MQNNKINPLAMQEPRISFFRERAIGHRTRQIIAGALAAAMLPFTLGVAWSQDAPPPPPDTYDSGAPQSDYQPLPADQLDQLVAPIALYPDALVAQVLAASTYPQQVVAAQQFVQQSGNYPPSQLAEMANEQPWDPSVKSLVAFPQVLNNLNQNMNWTTQLGNAYYNQPQDVMEAVQDMRQRAYAAGNLRSTPQLDVNYDPGNIVISPVSENIVYVPYYNPWAVYGAPLPVYAGYYWGPPRGVVFAGGLALGFGVGLAIGAFGHFGWGYHNWAPNWRDHAVFYNHTTFISHSTTVYNRGHFGGYNGHAGNFNHVNFSNIHNTTINNNHVTVNRGGNTYNRGGNTFNRGGNTYNRGGNTFNRGGNTVNRGGNTFNNGGNTVNRGANTYNRGGQTSNPGAGTYNRGGQTYNRGAATPTPQANRGNYNQHAAAPSHAQARPAPSHSSGSHAESHGGGHEHGH
jgi:hypothetical protein